MIRGRLSIEEEKIEGKLLMGMFISIAIFLGMLMAY